MCPRAARLLAIGPSIANVLEYYGHHQVSALSVSTNPRDRNPSYTPVPNPDLALRNGDFQYIVWDAYTAAPYRVLRRRSAPAGPASSTGSPCTPRPPRSRLRPGATRSEPVIVIYEVHP